MATFYSEAGEKLPTTTKTFSEMNLWEQYQALSGMEGYQIRVTDAERKQFFSRYESIVQSAQGTNLGSWQSDLLSRLEKEGFEPGKYVVGKTGLNILGTRAGELYPEEWAAASKKTPWYKQTAGKWFAGSLAVFTAAVGAGVAGVFGTVGAGEGVAAVGGSSAAGLDISSFAAYDAAIAEGAAAGVGTVPAGTALVNGGAGSLITLGGTKTLAETLGLTALASSLFGTGKDVLSEKVESFVQDVLGGSSPGGSTASGSSGDGGFFGEGGIVKPSFLPWILIGLTVIGAYILTRRHKR